MADDNASFIIIAIAVIIVIALFVAAFFLGVGISDASSSTNANLTTSGQFLGDCTQTTCNDNLVCDGSNFTCRLPAGETCTQSSDCVVGFFCSGICTTGPTGGLNDFCPCLPGLQCTSLANGTHVCKGLGGATCGTGTDCVSDICNNGVCAAGFPNSAPCERNNDCASDNCSRGFCQPRNVVTGDLGASCAAPCVDFAGATCESTPAEPLVCVCSQGTGLPGTCKRANQGLLSGCSVNSICSRDLFCYNESAQVCTENDIGCLCLFPYNDVNAVGPDDLCIQEMVATSNGCVNGTGLGCSIGGDCSTNLCGGGPVMAGYTFSTIVEADAGTNFLNATNTLISPLFPGPTGTISPYKMFARTNNFVDTIYLVDRNLGLLSVGYNVQEGQVVDDWQVLIPLTTTGSTGSATFTRTLLDADTNAITTLDGATFLVAFNETVTNGMTTQTNDTVYVFNNGTLTPFNVQPGSGLDGTQYTNGTALSIDYISVSPANDVSAGGDVLISDTGSIYVKPQNQTNYTLGVITGGPNEGQTMTSTVGPAYFYYDTGTGPSVDNIALVTDITNVGVTLPDVLQFSGSQTQPGAYYPTDRFNANMPVSYQVFDYSIYSPHTGALQGMAHAGIIMLTQAFEGMTPIGFTVGVVSGFSNTLLPYRINTDSRVVATGQGFYILTPGSCS